MTRLRRASRLALLGWCFSLAFASSAASDAYTPVKWTKFVKVAGQDEPIPEQWLDTEEARIAHNMKLPDVVAKTVPFDFEKARLLALFPWMPPVGKQYFKHLCDTEAGEWLIKTAPGQPGIYNARPMRSYSTAEAQSRYDLEAPVLQRRRHDSRDDIETGSLFVMAPILTYTFVEEPRRGVDWQADISQPYIRMFGYRVQHWITDPPSAPMKAIGIEKPSAEYAFTWRGVMRKLERENSVSGMEMLVYHRNTYQVLAVRRQYIYGPPYKDRPGSNSWLQGEVCTRLTVNSYGGEHIVRLPLLATPPEVPMSRMQESQLRAPLPPKSLTH